MKKILILSLFLLVSCTNNPNKIHSGTGYKILKQDNTYIVEINTKKANFSFGGVETQDKNESIYKNKKSKFDRFTRYDIKNLLETHSNIELAINGQFFNAGKKITALSFPLKSDNKIITNHNDNDKLKKTLIITKENKLKIIDGYNENDLNNTEYKEIIIGINPNEDFIKNEKVGRTFAGIKDDLFVFFISEGNTQTEMVEKMEKYGILKENIVMFDGGPSSQFGYKKNDKINTFFGKWGVPHYFVIYK